MPPVDVTGVGKPVAVTVVKRISPSIGEVILLSEL